MKVTEATTEVEVEGDHLVEGTIQNLPVKFFTSIDIGLYPVTTHLIQIFCPRTIATKLPATNLKLTSPHLKEHMKTHGILIVVLLTMSPVT